jgi:hypothetical protein
VVDQLVELERVELAGVQPREALAYSLKQRAKLLLVVGADQFSGRTPAGALPVANTAFPTVAHGRHGSAQDDRAARRVWRRVVRRALRYGPVMPVDLAARISSEDHATLWGKVIALAARNGVEGLHAQGAFSDEQAPALNRRLRGYAYEVLIAIRRLDASRDDDRFTAYLLDLIDDWEQDPLGAALGRAVASAVWGVRGRRGDRRAHRSAA